MCMCVEDVKDQDKWGYRTPDSLEESKVEEIEI